MSASRNVEMRDVEFQGYHAPLRLVAVAVIRYAAFFCDTQG
ncbi:MAG: hypothetical protein RJA24_673 [Pseudomonadota bacterium]|jgi:hypothetical protein